MQIYYIFSSLWHNDIKGVLQNSPAKRKMMIGDACFAGSMIAPPVPTERDYADNYNDKDGIAFISASRRDETPAETNQLQHFLLTLLQTVPPNNQNYYSSALRRAE